MRTVAPLGELADFINGYAFAPADWHEDGLPIIRIQNLTDATKPFNRTRALVPDKYRVAPGELLVSWSASLGVFEWRGPETGIVNQHIFRVKPRNGVVEQTYLRHALDTALEEMKRHLHGATMQHVNRGEFLATPVLLPSLAEQRRIAAILDQADALRAKRRAALAQLDEMAQAIFVEMFGDLRRNERAWPVAPVATYVAHFQGGKSFEADVDNKSARNRVLKVSAVTSAVFLPSESKPLPDDYMPPPEHFVQPGDLLFSRANTTSLVGAVAYVMSTPDNVVLPDKLWRFVWRKPCVVEPLFVWALFQMPSVREELGRRATGTSGSMKNVSQAKLMAMPTILPPIAVQMAFVQRLDALRSVQAKHVTSTAYSDSLFASLQHRAFRGEL